MINHCYGTPLSDLISIKLCKNPGMNNHFTSEVPTFSAGYDRYPWPFRNKFCAECSGFKNETINIYWDLSIHCDAVISVNHENLMHVVQENNCEVYFKSPHYDVQHCNYPTDFTISSCNVTGLWQEYDNGIWAASWENLAYIASSFRVTEEDRLSEIDLSGPPSLFWMFSLLLKELIFIFSFVHMRKQRRGSAAQKLCRSAVPLFSLRR